MALCGGAGDAEGLRHVGGGVMIADGVRNVLRVLAASNPDGQGEADGIDLAETCTTRFAEQAS